MKITSPALLFLLILTVTGCQKSIQEIKDDQSSGQFSDSIVILPADSTILVDASKDGGVWWFPQSIETGFSDTGFHQGQALAEYVRSLGYQVDELPRGAVITNALLEKYSRIIRVAAFFPYTDDEITAYKNFLNKPGAIMLLQDHLSYTTNDKLSEYLGITFKGAVSGTITNFNSNEITNGVYDLPYMVGAVVTNAENNPNLVVLGSLSKGSYTVLNNSDPFNGQTDMDAPVMGILNNYPNTRIFFLGDGNGIENLPQPFTQNLVSWLFQ